MRIILMGLLLLSACAPATVEDFRSEGAAQAKELADELHQIQTRSDLQAAMPRLRRKFTKLADLALAARSFRMKYPEEPTPEPTAASDELFAELARLHELPGGRELIESAQAEAVERILR